MIARPAPRAIGVALDEGELKAYMATAAAVGFQPAALLEAQLLRFFKDRGVAVYDYQEVHRYLSAEALKVKATAGWWWRPLRERDARNVGVWGSYWRSVTPNLSSGTGMDYYDPQRAECRPTPLPIPLRVLVGVQQLTTAFGDAPQFLVTEIGVQHEARITTDPFICVTAPDMRRIIFDCWDEPGFTG